MDRVKLSQIAQLLTKIDQDIQVGKGMAEHSGNTELKRALTSIEKDVDNVRKLVNELQ